MTGNLETPVDRLSGLPLPIFVTRQMFEDAGEEIDEHHAFHRKKRSELGYLGENVDWEALTPEQMSLHLEGKAVRNSRLQLVPRRTHERYHHLFREPEQLPQIRSVKFKTAVLAVAGIVPREALDLPTSEEYRIVIMNNKQYRFLTGFRRMHFAGAYAKRPTEAFMKRDRMGRFFAQYAIEQSVGHLVDYPLIDEFLNTIDDKRRRVIGRNMLAEAVDESIASLIPISQEAFREGMFRRSNIDLRNTIAQFLFPSSIELLDSNLRINLGLAA